MPRPIGRRTDWPHDSFSEYIRQGPPKQSQQRETQAIDPDVRKLNLAAMSKCVGLYYNGRIHWAVANGTSTNNEIWTLDIARGGLWILRWTLPADWLYLYEDNTGVTHFCALVNNRIVEFTSSVSTQDLSLLLLVERPCVATVL